MGFVLSIMYLFIYYMTPTYLSESLAGLRIQLIIAVMLALVSLPVLYRSFIKKTTQSVALVGLSVAIIASILVARLWFSGAIAALAGFIPNAMAYFFVCLHCKTKKRLQALVLTLLVVTLLVIVHGYIDLSYGLGEQLPTQKLVAEDPVEYQENANATASPFIMKQGNDAEQPIYRLQGLGESNDPNDFGQLIVCVIPLVFIFWRPREYAMNFLMVLLPVSVLLIGAFLTHSRGTLIALTVVAVLAAYRHIGLIPSIALATCLFIGAMALQFTGGRGISANTGEDRTALWGQSLQLLKSHPVFGVGIGNLPDYLEDHKTAHNSVIVCAAELGVFGLFFWSLFLFPTARDAFVIASSSKVSEGKRVRVEEDPLPYKVSYSRAIDKSEINRLGRLMFLSLAGYFCTGWFLSRSFVITLFLLGGMTEVVYEMALDRGMIVPRMKLGRALPYSGLLAVVLLITVYVVIRILNLVH